MTHQTVFKRYELKYMLTQEQRERLLREITQHMSLDKYGRTTIRNIYLDTDDYRIIRRSIEKPAYKEKLRIRSYSQATPGSTVFVELKKKYDKIVYKRRIALSEQDATNWGCHGGDPPCDTQISREIEYFIDFYGDLTPTVLLSYERCANFDNGGTDFRVTFASECLQGARTSIYAQRFTASRCCRKIVC